jgi:hypothetical protein
MNLKPLWREVARIGSQYTSAVICESDGRLSRLVPTVYSLLLARLRYGVGPRYYSLFELARLPRDAWSDFVTDDPSFKQLLLDASPPEAHDIANDKALFHRHCVQHGLATVPILCVVSDASAKEYADLRRVTSLEQWQAAMTDAPDEVFVKSIDGTFGEGAFSVRRSGDIVDYDGRRGSLADLYRHLVGLLAEQRGWLVQPRLRCHDDIARIMGARGLGTVRVVTCFDNGRARLLLAIMKITVGTNVTDNFHHGSTGNLVAAIDLGSGRLSAARGSMRKDWPTMQELPNHPDSGERIEGFVVPAWDQVIRLALQAQESLPQLKSAGWDIAVTDAGPLLVETNLTYSVDIMQVAHRRGLKRQLMHELRQAAG